MVRSPFGHDLIESRPAITRASFPEELRGLSEKHRCKSAPGKFDAGIFKVRVPREGFRSTPCEGTVIVECCPSMSHTSELAAARLG
jgi:hypothetical protein